MVVKTMGVVAVAAFAATCSRGSQRGDHSHLALNQIGCHGWQSIVLTFSPTLLGSDVLPLDKSNLVQALEERGYERGPLPSCYATKQPDHRHRRLLSSRRERPRCHRAADQRDELAPSICPPGLKHVAL